MTSITQVAEAMRTVLTEQAAQAGKVTKFVKRTSKLGGAEFTQTLVFGWLSNPAATLEELAQTAATVGVPISAQGLDQRFTKEGALCLKQVLDAAVTQLIQGTAPAVPILARFGGVYLQDSTVVDLPGSLADEWRGCGNANDQGQAAVKIEVRLDLLRGEMIGPLLEAGRVNDAASHIQRVVIPAGALRIADLGYWSLPQLQAIGDSGGYWLSRVRSNLKITTPAGHCWEIVNFLQTVQGNQVDCAVVLSTHHPMPARLLAMRVSQEVADRQRSKLREAAARRQEPVSQRSLALADWVVVVTNLSQEQLSLPEAGLLLRIRWQIELLFKLWKSYGQIDEWRSTKPWRILCEVYAKLLAMLLQHWLLLVSCWQFDNRSWVKASHTIRRLALHLATAFASFPALLAAIATIQRCLQGGCRINKRKTQRHAFQLLLALSQLP